MLTTLSHLFPTWHIKRSLSMNDIYTLILLYIAFRVFKTYYDFYRTRKERPPGPLPLPFVGHIHLFLGNIGTAKSKLNDKYGDICEVEMFGYRCVVLSNPAYLKDVLNSSVRSPYQRRIPASRGFKKIGMDSEGILLNNDLPKWRHNRKFFQKSLQIPSLLELSIKYTGEACVELTKHWSMLKKNKVIQLDEWFRAFTTDVIRMIISSEEKESMELLYRKTIMGEKQDVSDENLPRGERYRQLQKLYTEACGFFVFIPDYLWGLPFLKQKFNYYTEVLGKLSRFELDMIEDRAKELKEQSNQPRTKKVHKDFLTLLLTEDQEETPEPDVIRQNMREMFGAGIGTTTSALCAVAYCLAQNPKHEERMVAEMFDVLGNDIVHSKVALDKLKFTECVINEAMRLHPLIPITYRYSPEISTKVGDYTFPPDTIFAVNYAHIHRDPAFFSNPDKFDPDRFADGWKDNLETFAFSPFGHGMRNCPGRSFAMVQMKTVMANIYRRFTIRLVDPKKPLNWQFTLLNEIRRTDVTIEPRNVMPRAHSIMHP